jgi:hypothetical protein
LFPPSDRAAMPAPDPHFTARAGLVTARPGGHCNGRQRRPQHSHSKGGDKYEKPPNEFTRCICRWQPGEFSSQRAYARCRQYTTPWPRWQGVDGTGTTSCVSRIDGRCNPAAGLWTYPVRDESSTSLMQPGCCKVARSFHSAPCRERGGRLVWANPQPRTKGIAMSETREHPRSKKTGALWPWPLSPLSRRRKRPR